MKLEINSTGKLENIQIRANSSETLLSSHERKEQLKR